MKTGMYHSSQSLLTQVFFSNRHLSFSSSDLGLIIFGLKGEFCFILKFDQNHLRRIYVLKRQAFQTMKIYFPVFYIFTEDAKLLLFLCIFFRIMFSDL